MDKQILAISGKPGLFVLVSAGRNTLIVETLDENKKRFSVTSRDKITSLNDVSMYTNGEDVTLMSVFRNIQTEYQNAPVNLDAKKASKAELEAFMEKALPDYDRDRVYQNDIRKLLFWYNLLIKNGITDFSDAEEEEEGAETAEKETEQA